ncbi:hypothetical protein NQ318_004301 [Aromia moschata]|uniref:Adenosine/AMP deaminase N-terminal domain-containing protein n=1 Tax=Aromia moschata TaxID=1265417 RepID=A0AAV8YTL0_9CUCU|nr:hypothetical protein NQ318_004301 [Aromia moschata]
MGASLSLTPKEQRVNDILMNYKLSEYDEGFLNPGSFLAAQHFFKSKAAIENSEIFKIIRQLPKGASLHSHDTAIASFEYLFNLTYRDNLYGCHKEEFFILRFFKENNASAECEWKLLSKLRAANSSFDAFLKSKMTLIVDYPEFAYPNLNSVWKAFMDIFVTVADLIGYKPVWQEYFYQVLKELYEDNVMYVEFRGILPEVYDLEGNTYDGVQVVGLYYETLKKFKKDYPAFHGARFIYAPQEEGLQRNGGQLRGDLPENEAALSGFRGGIRPGGPGGFRFVSNIFACRNKLYSEIFSLCEDHACFVDSS